MTLGVALAGAVLTVPVLFCCAVMAIVSVAFSGPSISILAPLCSSHSPFDLSVILIVASAVTAIWWVGQSVASRLHRVHRPHQLFTPYYDQR